MCGIVSYVGPSDGLSHVLDALELLAYRAPDSSGVAMLDEQGRMTIRRAVGTARQLQLKLQEEPLPPIYKGRLQVVAGHGRWAMVGAVTEANAHPIPDREGNRVICENGSHNAGLMLAGFAAQEAWWRRQGVPPGEAIHHTSNSSEILVYEWERLVADLTSGQPMPGSQEFLHRLKQSGIGDVEELALRLALWRFRQGNAHACAFYSRFRPDTLYISSHNKPIALAIRTETSGRQSLMVASDVNAALMLWSKEEVAAAKSRWQQPDLTPEQERALRQQFLVDVIFLDHQLSQGEELFARITPVLTEQGPMPQITLSRYDGSPLVAVSQRLSLSPTAVGRQLYETYTEGHIAEIPDVMTAVTKSYVRQAQVHLEASQGSVELDVPGLNLALLQRRFGWKCERLCRLRLIGEGSSWRDALAAAPLFRQLLPEIQVIVHRPVEMLNLGQPVDPTSDLAVEISWSGTTDSLLKVDKWLAGLDVVRLAITGRPQSDLGRRTSDSGGVINVLTGMELSVATVKGYQAILMVLNLLALQLSELQGDIKQSILREALIGQLSGELPNRLRSLIEDQDRRNCIHRVAKRCSRFNKIMVVGDSPIVVEAELKIEELAQVVACAAGFEDASLFALIDRCAGRVAETEQVLFIVNATSREGWLRSRPLLDRLVDSGLFFLIHTSDAAARSSDLEQANCEWFTSPKVSPLLQPLIDAPFYFELAVALAYAHGLTPAQIDQPRNLAKSVTTTGAEPRAEVEARDDFREMSLIQFATAASEITAEAGDLPPFWPDALGWNELLPETSILEENGLTVYAQDEAVQIGIRLAEAAWQMLTGTTLVLGEATERKLPAAGYSLVLQDEREVTLPPGLSAGQAEWLTALGMIRLALRFPLIERTTADLWQTGLDLLPRLLNDLQNNAQLSNQIRRDLTPFVKAGYDKMQIIGGGQDFAAALSIARCLREAGFMAEALYTDSAWHGPLAAVGGPEADHDTLILILATDPLFQAGALVDTQVYLSRLAHPFLMVPQGSGDLQTVQGLQATAVWQVPAAPRPFQSLINTAIGAMLAGQLAHLWKER